MSILAAADLHGDREVYAWLARVAATERPEAIVLAGDLLGHPDGYSTIEAAQRADAEVLADELEPLGIPVLYVMGNDDLIEMPSRAFLRSLHLRSSTLGGYSFVGYQCTLPFMGGIFEKPEAEIAVDVARIEHLVDDRTILVTHSPAHGTLDQGVLGRNIGSTSIRDLIAGRRPRAHVHGHCHAGFGREGIHFNVASARRKRAMVLDLDTMRSDVAIQE